MMIMVEWSLRPGEVQRAAERFLEGGGAPLDGVTILGRWHRADLSGGYTLVEMENPALVYRQSLEWTDVLDIRHHVVIDDEQAGAALVERFGT